MLLRARRLLQHAAVGWCLLQVQILLVLINQPCKGLLQWINIEFVEVSILDAAYRYKQSSRKYWRKRTLNSKHQTGTMALWKNMRMCTNTSMNTDICA